MAKERYHSSTKGELNLSPYEMLFNLGEEIKAFAEYHNYRHYHKGLGDVTPMMSISAVILK